LAGGEGLNTLIGGAGNDSYEILSPLDVIIEEVDAGSDGVYLVLTPGNVAAFSVYTLPDTIEFGSVRTESLGLPAITLRGNALNNVLFDTGSNILDGGAGADLLEGRGGDNTYIVDHGGDVIVEPNVNVFDSTAGGVDTVIASLRWSLAQTYIENLILIGTGNFFGVGNPYENTITGNDGANVLDGQARNDTLIGGAGFDTLIGGSGDDTLIGGTGNDKYIVD
jgi:Ca2+-binding RTX toxin-like protein